MPPTRVSVVRHQGRTAIAVDGRVIPGMAYFTYMLHAGTLRRDVLQEVVDGGTKIFLVLWQYWRPKHYAEPWTEDGRIDFTPLDEWMGALAGMAPDLWFVPRIFLGAPAWWARRHPGELCRYADDGLFVNQVDGQVDLGLPSMASARWRADAGDVLRRIVEHVESGPHADRVLGYMVNAGGTEEWVYPGSQQGRLPDYSAPAKEAFRRWLKNRYGGDEALARAWRRPGLRAGQAEIPTEAERRRCEPAVARDPGADRPSIDYEVFLSELCGDNLLEWCRVVKEATGGRRLTGAFYGYLLWQTGYASALVNNGHLAVRRLLESPDIDFLTGITSYDNRGTGEPGSFMLPVESLQAAGKLVFNEVDVRTHLSAGRPARSEIDPSFRNTHAYTSAESVSIYRREFAHHLIHGAAWWNFDMAGGWYACPEMRQELSRQAGIAREALAWDMGSVAEMALVVSASSPARQRLFTMQQVLADRAWLDLQCDRACTELYQAGLPVDGWMADDLGRPEMERYKVVYLFNALHMDGRERAWVERLKGGGRTLVFVGSAGLVSDEGIGAEQASALTGIRMRLDPGRQPLRIDVTDYGHPILAGCLSEVSLGTGALIGPCLAVDDPASTVLGCWRGSGAPAFAVRDFGAWRSVVCPAPLNHRLVVSGLAAWAGCHRWIDPPRILYANRSLLAVHIADSHEPMTVRLPEACTVTDLISGQEVAREARQFLIQRDYRKHTTFLYRLERRAGADRSAHATD